MVFAGRLTASLVTARAQRGRREGYDFTRNLVGVVPCGGERLSRQINQQLGEAKSAYAD